MTILLFVEGKSDQRTVPILIRKILGAKVKLLCRVAPRGDLFSAKKIATYVRFNIKSSDADKVIVLVDSECTSCEDTQSELGNTEKQLKRLKVKPLPQYCVVCHALEAWLGADLEALKHVAGKPVKLAENILEACKPKEVLEETFRKAGKDFDYMRDDPRIAEKIDPKVVAKKNPSFAYFRSIIKRK
jgi:hypothetical protein